MNEPYNDHENTPRPRREGQAISLDNFDDENYLFESSASKQLEGGSGEDEKDKDSQGSGRNAFRGFSNPTSPR